MCFQITQQLQKLAYPKKILEKNCDFLKITEEENRAHTASHGDRLILVTSRARDLT